MLNLLRQLTTGSQFVFPELRNDQPTLAGKPVHELSNMDGTLGGGAGNDSVLLYGDFSNFVVSQRIGSAVELIPTCSAPTSARPASAACICTPATAAIRSTTPRSGCLWPKDFRGWRPVAVAGSKRGRGPQPQGLVAVRGTTDSRGWGTTGHSRPGQRDGAPWATGPPLEAGANDHTPGEHLQ